MIYPSWTSDNISVLPGWLSWINAVKEIISQVPEYFRTILFKVIDRTVMFKKESKHGNL